MNQAWRDDALCTQLGPHIFYPNPGEGCGIVRDAKRICRKCPVRHECLQEALKNNEPYGIWGGLTGNERRRLKRGLPVHQPPLLQPCGTWSAYRRHLNNNEPIDDACRRFVNTAVRKSRLRRKSAS